ncbi:MULTISPECIES: RidA family protein [unclassified Bradyrhizobium]|uniref:RidA family protein n=1 Tax=unclassified Bradyrhizobium TaxID=2631580 RepID=UPI0029168D0F|nr:MULTISPECIES: Rid family hydrolase [unclassified Bradyrhizobium]
MRALSPSSIRPPLANYSHGIAVPAGNRLVITAGQLGIAVDESIPEDSEAQADICFANIAAILAEDGMTMSDVVRLSVYVTGREHMQGYRRSRDRQFPGTPPTTTLIVVAGLVRPEFVIEIEAIAVAPERIDRNTVA